MPSGGEFRLLPRAHTSTSTSSTHSSHRCVSSPVLELFPLALLLCSEVREAHHSPSLLSCFFVTHRQSLPVELIAQEHKCSVQDAQQQGQSTLSFRSLHVLTCTAAKRGQSKHLPVPSECKCGTMSGKSLSGRRRG